MNLSLDETNLSVVTVTCDWQSSETAPAASSAAISCNKNKPKSQILVGQHKRGRQLTNQREAGAGLEGTGANTSPRVYWASNRNILFCSKHPLHEICTWPAFYLDLQKSTNNLLTVTASYRRHMKFFLTAARSLPDLPARQLKPAKPDAVAQPFPLHRPGILAMASVPIGAVDEQSRCARESQVKIDSTSHVQMEPCRWRLLRLQPAPVLNHVVPHLLFSTRGCAVLLKGTRENHLRLATFAGNINCADSKNKSGNECQHVRSEQFISEEIQKHCTKKKMTITGKKISPRV